MRRIALKYRLAALMMSALMLVSSTGVALDIHYCQDVQKSVRLFGEAPTCHDQEARADMPACHKKMLEEPVCENNCCSHAVIHAQLDTDVLVPEHNMQVDVHPFIQIFYTAFTLTYDQAVTGHDHYLEYKPPQLKEDIPILLQSFLI